MAHLTPETQIGDQLQVTLVLGAGQIVQESSALADHLEQPAARVIVVLVASQMFGQGIDALGQQRDLYVGRAGVGCVEPVLLDDSGSIGLSKGHSYVLSLSPLSQ
jgi:hypothetical protein